MRALMILVAAGATLAAAVPVATVDSAVGFTLRGKAVPVSGAGGWAVFQGDQLATQKGSALLTFKDGSYVLVAKESSVQVMEKGGKVSLKVVKGEASYRLKAANSILFDGVEKMAGPVGMVKVENGGIFSAADAGYFAWLNRRASSSENAPIGLTYGVLPPGVTLVPGPEPISAFRP